MPSIDRKSELIARVSYFPNEDPWRSPATGSEFANVGEFVQNLPVIPKLAPSRVGTKANRTSLGPR